MRYTKSHDCLENYFFKGRTLSFLTKNVREKPLQEKRQFQQIQQGITIPTELEYGLIRKVQKGLLSVDPLFVIKLRVPLKLECVFEDINIFGGFSKKSRCFPIRVILFIPRAVETTIVFIITIASFSSMLKYKPTCISKFSFISHAFISNFLGAFQEFPAILRLIFFGCSCHKQIEYPLFNINIFGGFSKKSSDYLDKNTRSYFSNLINKMTITPIATNAKPRRLHNPITDTNSKVGALSPPALIFRNHDASDIKIKPIMKVTIPDPSIIFFLFIISLIKNYYQSINIFGANNYCAKHEVTR